jgi:hypothetical protein
MNGLNDSATAKQKKSFDYLIVNNYEIQNIKYLMRGKIRLYLKDSTIIDLFKNGKAYHAYEPTMPAIVKEIEII